MNKKKKAFSFIEMMTTVAVLSVGILAIYQSFFKSLEYINHMTYRLYASNLIANQIELIQKEFDVTGSIPLSRPNSVSVTLHGTKIDFLQKVDIQNLGAFSRIYEVTVSLSWKETGHIKHLSRSCIIYNDSLKAS